MLNKLLINNSKQIIWIKCTSSGLIKECNKPFLKLFNIATIPLYTNILSYFIDLSFPPDEIAKPQITTLSDNLIYSDIVLYFSQNNEYYEIIGELPSTNSYDIVNQLSVMNQEFMNMTNEINKKNSQLSKMLSTIRKTQSQLIQKEKMIGLGKIAAGIAHEINNPLGSITGNVEYLGNSVLTILKYYDEKYEKGEHDDVDWIKEDVPELMDDINTELKRISDIIKIFRDYSDIDRINDFYPYDINEGIKDTLELTKHKYEDDINIICAFNNIQQIIAKGSEINQIITHILDNAIHSFQDSGKTNKTIKIETKDYKNGAQVTITDNGKGIAKSILNRVFEPFFTTKTVGSGQGLGLTICYEIITKVYKGSIDITSKIGEGTLVKFWLPYEKEDLNDRENVDRI